MTGKTEQITKIRDYLLGKNLSEEEKNSIEESFMTSDEYFQNILIAEEDLIEEYLNNRLNSTERKDFEEKFLSTRERREKLHFETLLRNHFSEKTKSNPLKNEKEKTNRKESVPFWKKWVFSPIPVAAVVLLLLGGALVAVFYRSEDPVIASLNKAYALERPFESRVTALDYAPANNLRGKATDEKVNTISRKRAENLSLESVEKSATVQNLHNLGRVYLVEKQFDEAIMQLSKAQNIDPQNAEVLSDLGTALFEKSKILASTPDGKSFELAGQAMEEFEKALRLNPNLPEAQFNKAVCLQSRQMRREAREAWLDYLKLDSTSKWAGEARRNLELLDSQNSKLENQGDAVKDFLAAYRNGEEERGRRILNQNREMITGKLLPQQLAFLFLAKEGAERDEYLSALQYAGKLEKENFDDSFFFELATFYSSVSPENIVLLRESRKAVESGYKLSRENQYEKSLNEFSRAREIYAKTGDIWEEKICDYWIAYNIYQLSKNEESNKKFEELVEFGNSRKYSWFTSISLSRLSLNTLASNKYSKSLEYNKKALKLAEEISDLYQQQKSYLQLAELYQLLKQPAESFKNIENAFRLLDNPDASTRQKSRTYLVAAQIFYEKKQYAMAIHLLKEVLSLDEEVQEKTYSQYAYLVLSEVYDNSGDKEKAFDSAQKSLETAMTLGNEKSRTRAAAASFLQIADLQQSIGDSQEALKNYDRSIQIYETIDFPVNQYEAEKNRLTCYFENKDDQTIENEIKKVLRLFESNRRAILEEQNRNSFFDNEQNIYDLAIAYEHSKGNNEKAFDYAEESRSRSLLDIQENGAKLITEGNLPQIVFSEKSEVKPLQLNEIRAQLPEQAQVVEYSVLRDEIVMWLLTKDSFKTFSYKISSAELETKVSSFLRTIEQKNDEKDQARELYEILFQLFEEDLDKDKSVFIIPDKILFRLPFNALYSTKTDKFLIADYKILLSPSANVFLNSSKKAANYNAQSDEKLLSIGNPKFDQSLSENLPNLVSAEKEAKNIAGFYPKSEILVGEQATKDAFKKRLVESNIVHFAGHYVTNEVSPLLSSFLVAGNGEASRLTNYELLENRLDKTKLIVLSACDTGADGYFKGEGMIGAGRIFLASGVPLVVASQWKVDSDATTALMEKFHYFRKVQKMDTATALQKAQIAMLSGEKEMFRQPFYWAAFSAIGGYANF